jgi:hypothetical protein
VRNIAFIHFAVTPELPEHGVFRRQFHFFVLEEWLIFLGGRSFVDVGTDNVEVSEHGGAK